MILVVDPSAAQDAELVTLDGRLARINAQLRELPE